MSIELPPFSAASNDTLSSSRSITVCSRRAPMFSVFSFTLNAISAKLTTQDLLDMMKRVSIDKADIAGAEVKARTAQVTVRFVSQLVSVTRDRDGNVIDGNPDKVSDVTDVWTFARDLSSRDPNWKLIATEAGQ